MKKKVEIPTEEILRIYRLLEELNRFLHQPLHYDEHPAVVDWLKRGVYEELSTMYYDVVWEWLPDEEKRRIEEQ